MNPEKASLEMRHWAEGNPLGWALPSPTATQSRVLLSQQSPDATHRNPSNSVTSSQSTEKASLNSPCDAQDRGEMRRVKAGWTTGYSIQAGIFNTSYSFL